MNTSYAYLSHAFRHLQLYPIVITIYGVALALLHSTGHLCLGMRAAMATRPPGEQCWAHGNVLGLIDL